ncbi:MAG: cytochrome-c peroxidase [Campylobacterales bacterium]
MRYLVVIFLLLFELNAKAPLITPVPDSLPHSPAKAALGKQLFHDPKLSHDNTISCATCHPLANAGVDGLPVSIGIKGRQGKVNAPTVLNAALHFRQFWDGRAKDLTEQAIGPITNPVEMGSSLDEVVAKIKQDPSYVKQFKAIYPEGITPQTVIDAIVEFEKTLLTPNSRFDRYLKGDKRALTPDEVKGWELFNAKGCISCHNGVAIGGNMFQKFGIMKSLPDIPSNWGRYNVTKNPMDKFFFKVPSLRNIELTAPYLHDGSIKTLDEVVKVMARYQLGRSLSQDEATKIVLFLKALTAPLRGRQ